MVTMYSILAFLIVGTLWTVNSEIHSLTYIYTAFSKPVNLPGIHEFTAMGLLDDRMIDYYDSSLKKKIPKQPWMKERLEKDYWDKGTDSRKSKEQWFKVNLGILRDRMRHSNDTDLHILQWRHGCTAEKRAGDDTSVKFISGKDEYSYDGNDFLAFDDVNKRWIAPVDLAVPTKRKWDDVKMLNDYTQGYLERECVNWLSKFVDYGQEQLKNSIPPELHVYAKKSKNPTFINLHCMATGFLPKEVTLNIRRDGKVVDQLDGMQTTGVRPNGDDTYQIMNRVEILRSDSAKYSCEVIHPASNMHRTQVWDHSGPCDDSGPNIGAIVGGVAAGLLLVGFLMAVIYVKKRQGTSMAQLAEDRSTASSMAEQAALMTDGEKNLNWRNCETSSTDSGQGSSTGASNHSNTGDSNRSSPGDSRTGDSSPESTSLESTSLLRVECETSSNSNESGNGSVEDVKEMKNPNGQGSSTGDSNPSSPGDSSPGDSSPGAH